MGRGKELRLDQGLAKSLGAVLSIHRTAAQLSREELAEKVGMSDYMIAKIEQGAKKPSQEKFAEICNVLNVTEDEVIQSVLKDVAGTPPQWMVPDQSRSLESIADSLRRIAASMETAVDLLREQEDLSGLVDANDTEQNSVITWRREVAKGATPLGFTDWMAWHASERNGGES